MTLYENTEHGFSIEYPEGWTESTRGAGAHFSFEFKDPEGRLAASVSVDYKTDRIILADFVSEAKAYLESMPQYELISEGDTTIAEGILGYEMVGRGDLGRGEVEKFRFVTLAREQQGFWVGVSGEPADFDQQTQIINAIMDSFKLLPTYTFIPPTPSPGGTYTNAEYGFSITYPAGWIESPTGRPGEIIAFASAEGLPSVSVSLSPVGEGTTLAEFGPQLAQDLGQHWADYELISEGEITLDDGMPAYEIVFSGTMEGYNLKAKYVVVIQETQAFFIMGFSMPARFEQDEAVLDEVIHSFHLERPPSEPAIDLTGTWSGDWWRGDGGEEGTLIATLTQSGSSLSGDMTFTSTTFQYSQDTTISGSVEGSNVVFGMAIGSNGSVVTIDYNGTVSEDGNQMMGTYSMSTGYTGTWSVTRTMTTPTGEDIVVLSSNVFTTTSSILLDGESRRLHIVAELMNNSPSTMEIEKVYIHFYNASGQVACQRWAYAFDDIIPPGGITAIEETVPSGLYWDDETNDFPEQWASYEITLSTQPYEPAEGRARPVNVTVQDVKVSITESGGLLVTGTVVNMDQETAKHITPYIILYASDGTMLNADRDILTVELQPGQSGPFEIRFSAGEPVDYDHYIVKAYAENF